MNSGDINTPLYVFITPTLELLSSVINSPMYFTVPLAQDGDVNKTQLVIIKKENILTVTDAMMLIYSKRCCRRLGTRSGKVLELSNHFKLVSTFLFSAKSQSSLLQSLILQAF